MKRIILLSLLFLLTVVAFAQNSLTQKPALDTSVLGNNKWPKVGGNSGVSLSSDGIYVTYIIENDPGPGIVKSVIQSTISNWKVEELNIKGRIYFTKNSDKAVYINSGDSLCFVALGSHTAMYISNVSGFRPINQGKVEKLVYLQKDIDKTLILLDVKKGTRKSYAGVNNFYLLTDPYKVSGSGNGFIISRMVADWPEKKYSASWLDIFSGEETSFWAGSALQNVLFDDSANHAAFITETLQQRTIWLYKAGQLSALPITNDNSPGIELGYRIDRLERFNPASSQLFFLIKAPMFPTAPADAVKVDIWNYRDIEIQSKQLTDFSRGPKSFLSVINLNTHKILRLQGQNEEITLFNIDLSVTGFVTDSRQLSPWIKDAKLPSYFIDTETGKKKAVNYRLFGAPEIVVSPDKKKVIMADRSLGNFYSYEFATGKTINLTAQLPIPVGYDGMNKGILDRSTDGSYRKLEIAGWMEDSGDLLLYDQYDIWRLDVSGKRKGICLTNRYGRKHKIIFRLFGKRVDRKLPELDGKLLLSAFNRVTKNNGFSKTDKTKAVDPENIFKGPYFFSDRFAKAENAETWIVSRERTDQSANLFYTTSFTSFTQLSHLRPEANYNWMTSGLINFNALDGTRTQGILYRPENFDPKKSYPVIIYYYELLSDQLHHYLRPGFIYDIINIPWFVSRGYLVFTPDIYYEWGYPGRSALNSVVAAAKYLSSFSWIDRNHIGLQGHSWGGFETNYILTHSGKLFAAAMSSSGISNFISAYGAVSASGFTKGQAIFQGFAEGGQARIGYTPWQRPDLYLDNSAVLQADKISSPLLMMNNKLDGAVNFEQGVEFFLALRRLGKRAWMLQYDGEGHSVFNSDAVLQHTLRVTQFFDHYLKGAPAPKWMVEGIPAKRKGIDDGLELEPPGIIPGPGLITPEEQKKVDALKYRKPVIVKF